MEIEGYRRERQECSTDTMQRALGHDEKAFLRSLGRRIAELRKQQGLTQQQIADALEISQQHVASIEMGRRRIPVTLLAPLARLLAVSVEELIGEARTPAKRGPAPKLQAQLERLARLPKAKQRFVSQMIDTVLRQEAG